MTVKEFLQNYGGNECVSIEGYCEEEHYDYFREADEWELSMITQITTNRPA